MPVGGGGGERELSRDALRGQAGVIASLVLCNYMHVLFGPSHGNDSSLHLSPSVWLITQRLTWLLSLGQHGVYHILARDEVPETENI
jgi:hypothetical protein